MRQCLGNPLLGFTLQNQLACYGDKFCSDVGNDLNNKINYINILKTLKEIVQCRHQTFAERRSRQ